jgi:hypothetical protein
MIAWMLGVSMGVTAAALATGYARGGLWSWAVLWIALGSAAWFGRRRWARVGSVVFLGWTGAAVAGFLVGLGQGWMLLGGVAALVVWDLDHFARRLHTASRVEQEALLVRAHLQRIALVAGAGLLLGGLALLVQVQLSLGWAVLLGLLVMVGVQQFLVLLRRESD